MFIRIGETIINTDQIVNIDFEQESEKPEERMAVLYMSDGSKQTFFAGTIQRVLEYVGYVEL
jgi:hypothetical protein